MLFNEECQEFPIDAAMLDEIRRIVRKCIPEVKSSHCAEAVARGLGYKTNASLQSALKSQISIDLTPSRELFEEFLRERNYDVDNMQASLLPESVRIAAGRPWERLSTTQEWTNEVCSGCLDHFPALHIRSSYCEACKLREGRVYGCNHFERFFRRRILQSAFLDGCGTEEFDYLCVRPGWHDLLNSKNLRAEIAMLDRARDEIKRGNFENISLPPIRSYFALMGFVAAMSRLEVERKEAKIFWDNWMNKSHYDDIHFDMKLL